MKYIKFGNKSFDAIICLNATLPERIFFEKFKDVTIMAADGGSNKLLAINIIPDYIIGDLDSIDISKLPEEFDSSKIIKIDHQEKNDFEKILDFCIETKRINLLVTGIHGGVLEHTLNNLSVVKRYFKSLNLCIYDEERYGILTDESIRFETQPDEIISLIPFPTANIKTTNLKWELNNEFLTLGVRDGARNRATGEYVEIKINSGDLFIFFDPKLPYSPEL